MKILPRILACTLLTVLTAAGPLDAAQKTSSAPRAKVSAPVASSYMSLGTIASKVGMSISKSMNGDLLHYTLTSRFCKVEVDEGKRMCLVNGVSIQLSRDIVQQGSSLYISASDYHKMIEPLITPQNFLPAPKLKVIVLDPGHGGRDDGATNKTLRLREKDITLDIALKLKDELEERGYTVYLTRNKDKYVDLDARPAMANKIEADLFISLHFNATLDPRVHGAETYVLPPNGQPSSSGNDGDGAELSGNKFDAWNIIAGYYIQRELSKNIGTVDRGLRRARYAVLRPLDCPGLLIESGYVTNPGECYKLSTAAYRSKLADSIADAVDAYGKTLKRLNDSVKN